MNSINLPNEYIMQMYVNALAKKGVDKVLLLETLNEVNDVATKFLAMANDEVMKNGSGEKKKKGVKKTVQKTPEEKIHEEISSLEKKLFDSDNDTSDNETETCAFEYKGGKKKGTKCTETVEKDSEYCAGHNKTGKKTSDKKEVKVLSDTEENNANQVVAKTKVPCEFKLTAGKNKGKACGKVGCKAHTQILPVAA